MKEINFIQIFEMATNAYINTKLTPVLQIKLVRILYFENMSSGNLPSYPHPNMYSSICFITETAEATYSVFRLKQNVQSLPEASYSPILTLSAYLLYHHNDVKPPKFECREKTNGMTDSSYPSEALTVNGLFLPWCDYLSSLVVEGKCYQFQDQMYFMDFVSQEWVESFVKSEIFEFSEILKEKATSYQEAKDYVSVIQQVYGLQKLKVPKTRKMAAVCFSAKPSIPDPYLPKVHIPGLFFGIFYRQTDTWTIYRPLEDIFPTEQQLQELDGVILSGSAHAVYEDIPEINKLMSMLVNAYRKNEKLNILGFCFGHQSITYAFGGRVEKMPKQVVHLEDVRIDSQKIRQLNLKWLHEVENSDFLMGKQEYKVSQYHGDQATRVPEGFTVIGSSDSCPVEAMVANNGRILSFQFHMEYTPEFGKAYQLRLKSYNSGCGYGKIYEGSSKFQSCERNKRSLEELRFLSRKFLDNKSEEVQ